MIFIKLIFRSLFFLNGWKTDHSTIEVPKSIVVVVGHTSNWDFIYGAVTSWKKNLFIHFAIKEAWVKFPFRSLMLNMGAFAVKRTKTGEIQKSNFVSQAIDQFNNHETFHLTITPEASRSPRDQWRSGFYHIAKGANVPLVLGFVDYKRKMTGFGPVISVKDKTFEEVLIELNSFYKNITPKYPEKFKFAKTQ